MARRAGYDGEFTLTENEVDFLIYNVLPLYEQEMENTINKARDLVEDADIRQSLIKNFRMSINKAQALRHQLDG